MLEEFLRRGESEQSARAQMADCLELTARPLRQGRSL
jgi:hypothetical protein